MVKASGLLVPTLAAALLPLSAFAQEGKTNSLFQSHFATVAGGEPCYARSYSDDHLKAHPGQRVAEIEIDMAKVNPDGKPITEEAIELGFGIKLKDKTHWYTNVAICKSEGAHISCFLEGDGGAFTLSAAQDGAVRLETGNYGIAMEGADDFVELSGTEGDDRVFILQPADKNVCAASTEDVRQ